MSFDCSRFTFNSWNDFLGVVMQQGRVQLDADWNEFVSQLIRRIQAGTLDTFEQTVVPRVTPDGFRIDFNDGELTIGVGRIYVDGILAENHGAAPKKWDPRLAEQTGRDAINYTQQPYYYPKPLSLPEGEPFLVYLDVWQREVTYLQHPELVEKAVGVDTTARLQTVWQVKVLSKIGSALCDTPDKDVPRWSDVIRPSAARLTTSTGSVAASPNPCLIPPSGGYKGLENQLYRVEIHDDGVMGKATFKWSRDNGTVQSLISQINAARNRIVVDTVGRDALLRFSDGDWVEITDDVRELHGEPGEMRRIKLGGGVDDATRTIVLDTALPLGAFPTGAQDETNPARHTRIRRWDQSGQVLRADGTVFCDLDAAGSTGLIPVPPMGTTLCLEDGIQVQFDLVGDPDDSGGSFHVGDRWSFAARTADAWIEPLDHAPPLGTHHHYARLAVVNSPESVSDCRVFWPPEPTAGEGCSCDVCVTVGGHNDDTTTIQDAIGKLAGKGGVICLGAGIYRLSGPLRINGAGSLRIRGKGWRTVLVSTGPVIAIQDSLGVVLEDFAVVGAGAATGGETSVAGGANQDLVTASNTVGLELDHLYLLALSSGVGRAAVKLDGYALDTRVHECAIVADVGITGGMANPEVSSKEGLLTASLSISDNLLVCNRVGLQMGKGSFHYGDNTLSRNLVLGSRESGFVAQGGALLGSSFRIDANSLYVAGNGIVAGVDGLRITDNEIRSSRAREISNGIGSSNGIVLAAGLDPSGIEHVWITSNRLAEFPGNGIEVQVPVGSAIIKQNVVEHTYGGIVFVKAGASSHLSIENNQLLNIAEGYDPQGGSVVGIQVLAAREVDIVGNIVNNFAGDAWVASDRVAIRVAASGDVRISGNRLSELGPRKPRQEHLGYVAGIELQPPYTRAVLSENFISRSTADNLVPSQWHAIRIMPPSRENFLFAAGATIFPMDNGFYLLTGSRLQTLSAAPPESLSIRGNQGTAREITLPLVVAMGVASCIFSDNYFEATTAEKDLDGNAVAMVMLSAATVIASNNQLLWRNSERGGALNIFESNFYTVVGNITMGNIFIILNKKSQLLDGPWKLLNVIVS
ncbi:DUF6519 domain-containing protein [Crenobacter sp. SG2303]|uniref:DUF6519 domain-containing protein n=1 Tax=Crenobacter oryzisoli TaxID=3056844 RepID=A0ABT7XRA7_9NEIS|nr:DUF6519 domain-containing protein [Crenobacter sp. SG2303]MDN0075080.1 DUF6519 domain-containing protein [Crenobacter sp. SG2303]MDN0076312.1 DUF6519 domain-containing protein [Crenobacter sp. SG2303]